MRSICLRYVALLALIGCDPEGFQDENGDMVDPDQIEMSSQAISWSDANDLINDGRARLGTYGNQCKQWVSAITLSSYGVSLPSTDASPYSDQYKWLNDTTPATNVARWLGSYANGRLNPTTLGSGASISLPVSVPNYDPQVIVLYASTTGITATLTKSGSTTLSVTSTGGAGGTISANTTSGQGTWTLTVTNNGGSSASGVVAVVLSRSRFQSDWETARRGDIMQMFVGTSSNRANGGPHTTFIQTDYNTNGGTSCSGSPTSSVNTEGCNWLDSNWSPNLDGIVRAHNMSMNTMIKMAAYSPSYGFTVYRLN